MYLWHWMVARYLKLIVKYSLFVTDGIAFASNALDRMKDALVRVIKLNFLISIFRKIAKNSQD